MILKSNRQRMEKPFNHDEDIKKIREKIIHGNLSEDELLSQKEIGDMLETSYQNGEISEETYNIINNENILENFDDNEA
jgi:hypothetical protein